MAVISGKQKTIIIKKYYDFSHSWRFSYDTSDYEYVSEIRDEQENFIAEFEIIQDVNGITVKLTEATINAIELGTYYYDVKQISKTTGFAKAPIYGEIVIINGKTQSR